MKITKYFTATKAGKNNNHRMVGFFIDNAKYRAEDENGNVIWLKINYWNGKYEISQNNEQLENFAKKLLTKKHRVNLVHKIEE